MAFCNNCGKNLAPGQLFCDGCGAKQEVTVPVSNTVFPQSPVKSLNIILIVAAVLMGLGTFIPCYTISFFGATTSVSYIQGDGDGILVFIAAIAVVVLAMLKKEVFAVIPAGISIIALIVLCSNSSNAGIGLYGPGMYMMWIGAVATCVAPFIKKK